LVLGAFENSVYQEGLIEIKPHELLLLYTDGVTEIYNEAEEEFGVERLLSLVKRYSGLPAKEITVRLQENILGFAADQSIQDDFTLLVLKAQ
jgi:sigma-B regulation protein RsbU (phosphoserine phosphatase)